MIIVFVVQGYFFFVAMWLIMTNLAWFWLESKQNKWHEEERV